MDDPPIRQHRDNLVVVQSLSCVYSVSIWWKKEERTEGGKVGREKARKEEQEVGRGRTL